ncbi:hypothetical protein J2Z23_004178 [Lederbergia galactosidilyticus]|uniref:toll/interleukin-1 receptor domain-containing protein n=1 Tax=Lederbergia galactosidilytica TaxID=217031 RepID=UPI001AEA26DE|nr:toll/interleukin-1 receptor domain-containing protein [Lederbergia galactosidilytica]MBP1917193.1 hypothetical protein [Lederbergia galactosidilytica]
MKTEITAFISYSWESEEVISFANWLANFIEKYNIKVNLDQLDVFPGSNLQKFMEQGLNKSRYILPIVTESYKNKMDDPKTGVGTEVALIKSLQTNPYIIPIVHSEKTIDFPEIFEGKFATKVDMSNPTSIKNKDELYKLISVIADNEGILPTSVNSPIEKYGVTAMQLKLYSTIFGNMQFDTKLQDSVKFYYANNDGDFYFGKEKMSFTTHWSTRGRDSIYSYNKVQTFCKIPALNDLDKIKQISDIQKFSQDNFKWDGTFYIGDGLLWINKHDIVAIGLVKNIFKDQDNEINCFVEFEYKILNPIENESIFEEARV